MVKLRHLMTAAAIATLSGPAFAACPYPEEVAVPDGSIATSEEMLDGQKSVKSYIAAMEDYLKCLDAEEIAMGDAVTEEERALHVKRHNAAVDAMEKLANDFNEQIRAFRAAND